MRERIVGEHPVGLGRGEHELDVRRRLLDDLEQGVEALRGHHVRLVDDVDLVAARHRAERRPLAQLAGVVDAAVAGGVDLDDVEAAGPAAGQVAAALALAARLGDRRLLAVEGAGQDAGAGGLAAAARAGEQVGVVHPVGRQRLPQRLGDVVLAEDLGEPFRPVAAVQGEGGVHACTLTTRPDETTPARPDPQPISRHCGGRGDHDVTTSVPGRTGCGQMWAARDPSRTRQSLPTLAAFRPWGSWAGCRRARGCAHRTGPGGPVGTVPWAAATLLGGGFA